MHNAKVLFIAFCLCACKIMGIAYNVSGTGVVWKAGRMGAGSVQFDISVTDDERRRQRLAAARRQAERASLGKAVPLRLLALLAVLFWALTIDRSGDNPVIYYALAALAANAAMLATLNHSTWFKPWQLYAFAALDHAIIGWALATPLSVGDQILPLAINGRHAWVAAFMLFIAASCLALRPWLVLWNGVCASTAWCMALARMLAEEGSFTRPIDWTWQAMPIETWLSVSLDPRYVDLNAAGTQIVLLFLSSVLLALAVRRARLIALRQAENEYQHAHLARRFAPDLADSLAGASIALPQPAFCAAAVLAVQIIDFARLCHDWPPKESLNALKVFRVLMEKSAFRHGGTIDSHYGASLVVAFDLLQPTGRGPAAALDCAFAMQEAMAEWNNERALHNQPFVRAAVGLHYGPAVVGDLGLSMRSDLVIMGETAETAQGLARLAGALAACVLISDEAAGAIALTAGNKTLRGFLRIEGLPARAGMAQVAWLLPESGAPLFGKQGDA
jgi:adenylate cyclase